jgi:hypothetical protein
MNVTRMHSFRFSVNWFRLPLRIALENRKAKRQVLRADFNSAAKAEFGLFNRQYSTCASSPTAMLTLFLLVPLSVLECCSAH